MSSMTLSVRTSFVSLHHECPISTGILLVFSSLNQNNNYIISSWKGFKSANEEMLVPLLMSSLKQGLPTSEISYVYLECFYSLLQRNDNKRWNSIM